MRTKIFSAAGDFLKKNVVLAVAFVLAVGTMFLVPPDAGYAAYFDWKTLTCLFCTLAVVGALRNVNFFSYLARRIVCLTGTLRAAVTAVVCITFLGSMLLANDMALITFLPLGYYVLTCTGHREIMAFVFILQNIAANLGGMLTPFGNPQNLYLYEHFRIGNGEFFRIMLPSFLVAIALILLCCTVFVKNERFGTLTLEGPVPPKKRTTLYLALFVFSILLVFRTIPYPIGLVLITGVLLAVDRKALAEVDYPLLLTFVCFFVFSGNLARVDAVNRVLSGLLAKKHAAGIGAFVPVYQQCAFGGSAFAFHNRLPESSAGRKHRRNRDADRVACQHDYLPGIRQGRPRSYQAVSGFVCSIEFLFPRRFGRMESDCLKRLQFRKKSVILNTDNF